jgi:hypothetical protein
MIKSTATDPKFYSTSDSLQWFFRYNPTQKKEKKKNISNRVHRINNCISIVACCPLLLLLHNRHGTLADFAPPMLADPGHLRRHFRRKNFAKKHIPEALRRFTLGFPPRLLTHTSLAPRQYLISLHIYFLAICTPNRFCQ